MTIIVLRNQEAAGQNRQGTNSPAQPCATRDSAQIKFTEHVGQGVFALSAICAGDGACVRATGILGSLETETVAPQIQRPAPNFKSATRDADTGGLSHALPACLRFKFFPIVKAIGSRMTMWQLFKMKLKLLSLAWRLRRAKRKGSQNEHP